MIFTLLSCISLIFAAIPTYIFLRNYSIFRRLPEATETGELPSVSVLIPARNEEEAIGPCVQRVLDNEGVELEVIVLDDQSEDATRACVEEIAERDSRVRVESARALPAGWCGKQHACSQLGELAGNDLFVFLDADVRLTSDALIRIASAYKSTGADLLSGFPRQRTETIAEQLLIPLIHFVLLGFLSLRRMRASTHPAFGAGCGQLFVTSRDAYLASGGHAEIKTSLHDGIKLPRLYRSKGLSTDLFDGTDIATCRMYRSAAEVWNGLKKNATEGVANASLIGPVTAMLFCGQVLPFILLAFGGVWDDDKTLLPAPAMGVVIALSACLIAMLPRLVAKISYRQSLAGALLHPFAIVCFLAIQWSAFLGSFSSQPVSWKGRPYPAS